MAQTPYLGPTTPQSPWPAWPAPPPPVMFMGQPLGIPRLGIRGGMLGGPPEAGGGGGGGGGGLDALQGGASGGIPMSGAAPNQGMPDQGGNYGGGSLNEGSGYQPPRLEDSSPGLAGMLGGMGGGGLKAALSMLMGGGLMGGALGLAGPALGRGASNLYRNTRLPGGGTMQDRIGNMFNKPGKDGYELPGGVDRFQGHGGMMEDVNSGSQADEWQPYDLPYPDAPYSGNGVSYAPQSAYGRDAVDVEELGPPGQYQDQGAYYGYQPGDVEVNGLGPMPSYPYPEAPGTAYQPDAVEVEELEPPPEEYEPQWNYNFETGEWEEI